MTGTTDVVSRPGRWTATKATRREQAITIAPRDKPATAARNAGVRTPVQREAL
jgi:hypothetical protein